MSKLVKASAVLPGHVTKDRVVQRLLEAERALGVAVGLDQVRLVMDAAAAQEVFAKRQRLGEEVIGFAHTIKTRALARLGELLREIEKNVGARGGGKKQGSRGAYLEPRDTAPEPEKAPPRNNVGSDSADDLSGMITAAEIRW